MIRFCAVAALVMLACPAWGEDIPARDHTVTVTSTVPVIAGQKSTLYVRERALPKVLRHGAGGKVVLFVHGAGTPAEVSFDVPYQDYSWMGYLAAAGYDVFSVDMTGYGRSARPKPMDDKCNLAPNQQKEFGVSCPQSYPGNLTNIESDWNDISAAVAFIQKLRHVKKLNLVGWSQGGPRAGGWTANHPGQVAKLILLAPAYNRNAKTDAPPLPVPGPVFNTQSHDEFIANWDRQAPCPGQYDPAAAQSVWSEMLKSDPAGAGWSPAVRRAPIASSGWGWTQAKVQAMTTPILMVSGVNDKQVNPERVRDFYADIGSPRKVFIDLACSSHNAMWEKNHLLLFRASLEWLEKGTVNSQSNAMLKLGY
ncbi:MAG TPA: alpha/beta fold hydrolase [Rhizomicrobium sp.]|nr:alpha/beta fold hydrolase [Rhizomicrobium sp.]